MPVIENVGFPSHLVDPREKGKEWVLTYCKAAYASFENDNPREIFYHSRYKYEVQKSYALGNQSINKYKPLMGVDEEAKEDWLSIDWSVIPIVPKFRRIALGKLSKSEYNIVATAIDALSNNETKEYFAKLQAKIMVREQAAKIDPTLLDSPSLQLSPNEAKDMEELEMQMKYTFKHQMSIEAEEGIKLIFGQNDVNKLRYKVREDLYDHGVGGYKEFIDSNGAIKIRAITPRNIVMNRCNLQDFSDASHIGEIIQLTISELKSMAQGQFTDEDYEQIAKAYIGLLGNPKEWPSSLSVYNKGYDRFKIRVLDLELESVNQIVMEKRTDRRGNKIYARGKFEDTNKRKDKFDRVAYKVIYKGKWIVGTNYIFDYGLATDMKRAKSSLMDTSLSYHIFAPEFFDMKAYGMMDQMIPIADAIQIAWYRLQNAINQARPKGIMIEMGALEEIPLGAGGKKLTPMKVLDLYNKTGTLVYRKSDLQGRQTNYKPIEELENGLGRDVMNYWTIIQNNIQLLRDITGMNEMTDGSTPDPRTLTTIANLANESTNNALSHIVSAERALLDSLANSVMLRLQDVVTSGKVEGYLNSLGTNTMKFIQVSKKLSLHEFGIFLEDKPTSDQKAMLLQQVQAMSAQGLMDIEDAIIIENTDNLKVAQQLLAYKMKKRKEENQQNAMQQQQQNGQIQQQSAQMAEQSKQQTLQVEGQIKGQLITMEKQFDAKLMKMKYDYELQLKQLEMTGKVTTKHMENVGKTNVAKIKLGESGDETDQNPSIEQQPMQQQTQQMSGDMEEQQEDQSGMQEDPSQEMPQESQEQQVPQ